MNRRDVIAWSGVVVGTGIGVATSGQAAGTGDEPAVEHKVVKDRDLAELETLAQESPEKLSDDELRRVLTEHNDHSVCPVCAGLPGQLDSADAPV